MVGVESDDEFALSLPERVVEISRFGAGAFLSGNIGAVQFAGKIRDFRAVSIVEDISFVRVFDTDGTERGFTEKAHWLIVGCDEDVDGAFEDDWARRPVGRLPRRDVEERGLGKIEHLGNEENVKEPLGGGIHGPSDTPIEVANRENHGDEDKNADGPETRSWFKGALRRGPRWRWSLSS